MISYSSVLYHIFLTHCQWAVEMVSPFPRSGKESEGQAAVRAASYIFHRTVVLCHHFLFDHLVFSSKKTHIFFLTLEFHRSNIHCEFLISRSHRLYSPVTPPGNKPISFLLSKM